MLVGMALYKMGVLTGQAQSGVYRRIAIVGIPLGAAASIWGVVQNFRASWSLEYSMFLGGIPNYWGSIGVGSDDPKDVFY